MASARLLDFEQMGGGVDHPAVLRGVLHRDRVMTAAQAQAPHRRGDVRELSVNTLEERHLEGACHDAYPVISSSVLPRFAAMSSGERMLERALMVARTTLIGLREP